MDSYEVYCAWCEAHHHTPPTREWWDWACTQRNPPLTEAQRRVEAGMFDIDTERREGWGYADPR